MFLLMTSLRDEMVVSRILRFDPDRIVLPEEETMRKGASRLMNQTNPEQVELQVPNVLFLPPPREIFAQIVARRLAAEKEAAEKQKQEEIAQALSEKRPEIGKEAKEFGLKHTWGRNEPCPCGSGRKFKKCCMKA
jgi:uncharacterized protein YecA (UPF0149 family)